MSTTPPLDEESLLSVLSRINDRLDGTLFDIGSVIDENKPQGMHPTTELRMIQGAFQRLRLDLMSVHSDLAEHGFSMGLGERAGIVLIQSIALVKFVNSGGIHDLREELKTDG